MEGSDSAETETADTLMTTVSHHHFGDEMDEPAFSISIIENMKEDYGLFVWPCSVVLAEYVWQQRLRFSGAGVVELGAGTSLPGLVAVKVGADVTLTDDSSRLEVLDNMKRVLDLNKLECNFCFQVLGLTWGVWDASTFSLHPKFILGADVLYDASAFDDLFATVTFLLQCSPGSVFITTYHNRRKHFVCIMCSGHHLIEFLMVKWGLKCVKLLDAFSFMPSHKASGLSGNLQLAEIVLDSQRAEIPVLH
ncbi:methyltransferase-like protein 23 isoform X2 [Prunus avium]|uniref:Methyltransferase-like protein 23 isoform X2 n=1 Tax=Prunus avium TaxID=42229 RepID=A0A6P5SQG9_PRUAV|nr:methyltransferase-like protein 23 isoform X2 [Prunus avium]